MRRPRAAARRGGDAVTETTKTRRRGAAGDRDDQNAAARRGGDAVTETTKTRRRGAAAAPRRRGDRDDRTWRHGDDAVTEKTKPRDDQTRDDQKRGKNETPRRTPIRNTRSHCHDRMPMASTTLSHGLSGSSASSVAGPSPPRASSAGSRIVRRGFPCSMVAVCASDEAFGRLYQIYAKRCLSLVTGVPAADLAAMPRSRSGDKHSNYG